MDTNTLQNLKMQLHNQLNGTPEHDRNVLERWLEQYHGDPEAEPLLREIGQFLFQLDEEKNGQLTRQFLDETVRFAEQAFSAAQGQIELGKYEEALQALSPTVEMIDQFTFSDQYVWMDFNSMLDGLLYQDYFDHEINGREIRRHPLKPGKYLYAYGSLLVELGRAEEAIDPLELLLSFDPVCPKYLFELGEAYKRSGRLQDAFNTSLWAVSCASNHAEIARCYRDMAFCLSESASYEDAALLYQLSLGFQSSPRVEVELFWIAEKTGITPVKYSKDELLARCEMLGVPVGFSKIVLDNLKLLESAFLSQKQNGGTETD